MEPAEQTITYRFALEDDQIIEQSVTLSNRYDTPNVPEQPPEWTRLEVNQCEGCRWKETEYCPVALRLIEPLEALGELTSWSQATITVQTQERTYQKHTDLQTGLSGLFGLIMATSGCPTMEPFRAMAWFHLPFASPDETFFRFASSRLFIAYLHGKTFPDPNDFIEHITQHYESVEHVNAGIFARLKSAVSGKYDSSHNAIVMLDAMGRLMPMHAKQNIDSLKAIFT